ncbi:MAG: exodeoxyribonuclease III [Actinomycetaceae bacterium]|nr:exodeoxyribonuclease III [Actinomycetaceae bacterium]
MTFSLASINVNGIRAAVKRGMHDSLAQTKPDVITLQEVRASDEITASLLGEDWDLVTFPCEVKGRAGVAIGVRKDSHVKLDAATVRYGAQPEGVEAIPVDTGRWLEVDILDGDHRVTVVSAYLHSGQVGTEKMDQKYAHLDLVTPRMQELFNEDRDVVVTGDLNIVHTELDIKNWKGNHNKTAGVLDEEIAYVDRWLGMGWRDVVRDFTGNEQGPYTWWSYRGKAFDTNAGWRIDYHLATPSLANAATSVHVDRAADYASRYSDHAPLRIIYG